MTSLLKRFARNDDGATMVEYGVMIALIAAVCITAVGLLGGYVNTAFGKINTALVTAGM